MMRPPQKAASIFKAESMVSVIFYGLMQTAICIGVFLFSVHAYGNAVAVTMTFFVLSFLELFHSFNIRSERNSAFGKGFFSNKMLFITVFAGIFVNLLLCVFAPVRAAFDISSLNMVQWITVFVSSVLIIPIAEVYKIAVRWFCRKKERTYNKKIDKIPVLQREIAAQ